MTTSTTRPALLAPQLAGDEINHGQWLTTYHWRDDSEYTIREYDYRLRWTLRPYTRRDDTYADENVRATVEVWNYRAGGWLTVWEFDEEYTYMVSDEQELLNRLALNAAEVLVP